ncbi:nSTAND1 domain-containing NTPase [Nocardiopsis valliformis]|uniref:nSTAND1 domain-containing NTPase n=1 Tax=Nocardiopsis valliformis TaxID=239974 RepID=UPI00034BAF83|nr:trypsin-like peptidase domain-containing protein [Nocardiopsis valliformis]
MTGTAPRSAGQALDSGVARIAGQDGRPRGTGALIAPDLVLTCAHVVTNCLGEPGPNPEDPGAEVMVDFPLAGPAARGFSPRPAEVERWIPARTDWTGDVALLRLREPVPGTHPLPLAEPEDVWGHPARAVGFTESEPTTRWIRGLLGGSTEEGWVQLSRADGQTTHVKQGFSGGPVWDEGLGSAIGLVVVSQPEREAQQAFVLRTDTILRELPELETVVRPDSPFRGLAALGEADADVFFGRGDDVDRVVEALRGGSAPVTVYGPSGCGKSSLALAGAVPRMRQHGYEVVVLDAGRTASPRKALATELSEMAASGRYGGERAGRADPERVLEWLDESGIAHTVHQVTGGQGTNVLIVLDQAEALLNLPEPEIDRTVALLFPENGTDGFRVLLTLRADFMATALSHPGVGPALRRGSTLPLTPMGPEQLHEVITGPLNGIPGVEYDPGLDQRILDDAGHDPGALPLLGFVLAKLWERRSGGRLSSEAYEDLGRVSGALKRHAEQAWRACVRPGEEQQERRLLTGLVRVLPGGEAPLRRVLTRAEVGDRLWELVQELARPQWRLLVLHGDGHSQSVELSHEALIREWPELAEEAGASADFLAVRAEIQHDLERWREKMRALDLLPGHTQLDGWKAKLSHREGELTGEQREFLGRARRRRARRRAAAMMTGGAIVVVLVVLGGLLGTLWEESRVRAEREAEGMSRSLAIQSDELMSVNPVQAALVALTAYETAPTEEARSALMRRYLSFQHNEWVLSGAEGQIQEAVMSADGTVILVRTVRGRATLFVRTDEGGLRQEQLGLKENVLLPSVSRDGRRIAYVHDVDGTVVWHDVLPEGERLLGPPNQLEGAMEDISLGVTVFGGMRVMDFSPEARLLVGTSAADSDRPVQVWDLETGKPRSLPEDVPRLREVWFGPDEDTLVAVAADPGTLMTIDAATGRVRALAEDVDGQQVGASGDGGVAVVCRTEESSPDPDGFTAREAHYRALRVADGEVLAEHSQSSGYSSCGGSAVSERGERFVVPGTDDEWELVDTSGSDEVAQLVGPQRPASRGRFPLLGTGSDPVIVTQDDNTITGWRMPESGGMDVHGDPRLLGDGGTMVLRLGPQGRTLRVEETEGEKRILAGVDRDFAVPADPDQMIQVNPAESLVADIGDLNRVTVYELPSLRRVSEFTTIAPSTGWEERLEYLHVRFLDDDRILTHTGADLELWDARTGRRLSVMNLDDLRLTEQEEPYYSVSAFGSPALDHVLINIDREPGLYAVDLTTGERREELDVRIDDVVAAFLLEDPRYMAVLDTGGIVELWSVPPGGTPEKVVGSLGPLPSNGWTLAAPEGPAFILATGGSVQFLRADDPTHRETYQFGGPQGFAAVTRDGQALLRAPAQGGRMSLLRLNPQLWKEHLCAVAGRELTADEVGALPPGLPDKVCSRDL